MSLLLALTTLSACASHPAAAPTEKVFRGDPRSPVIFRGDGRSATWDEVVAGAADADVVFIGENHGHPFGLAAAAALWEDLLEGIGVMVIMSSIFTFFAWLVRVVLDHRRWLRQSRTQVEAHAKILDRLTSHDDLLAYIQSPAGQRFLESAPIEIDGRQRPVNTSLSRVLLAVQAGIVLVATPESTTLEQFRFVPEPPESESAATWKACGLSKFEACPNAIAASTGFFPASESGG